jgi:hypothetical protein
MNYKINNIFVSELGSKSFAYHAHLRDSRKIFSAYMRIVGNAKKALYFQNII